MKKKTYKVVQTTTYNGQRRETELETFNRKADANAYLNRCYTTVSRTFRIVEG